MAHKGFPLAVVQNGNLKVPVMLNTKILFAISLVAILNTASAQLDRPWNGVWKGSAKSVLEITPDRLRYRYIQCDEDGSGCQMTKPVLCGWSRDGDAITANPGVGKCRFGISQHTRSRDQIIAKFEAAAKQLVKDNPSTSRFVSKSRNELAALKAGVFQVMILDNYSDVSEFVSDGEHIYLIANAHVEQYSRASR